MARWFDSLDSGLMVTLMASSSPDLLKDKKAFLAEIKTLDLSCREMKEVPRIIEEMPNLWYLDLGFNQIESIPEDFVINSPLTNLSLTRNNLTEFSFKHFGPTALKHLRSLSITTNKLDKFPDKAYLAQDLAVLSLDRNNISSLEGVKLPMGLKNLQMSWNLLEDISESCGQLSKCWELNFYHNRLTNIPPDLFKGNILSINLADNPIADWGFIPDAMKSGAGLVT